ncbi:EthD domain-containing protein [Aquihabitans sp. McL0605]|uniref:EthD domain-containing protein n=1 Tax=Aquihabitans sp. McL0605 TaxID=3415671 RepID=UPI003CF49C00
MIQRLRFATMREGADPARFESALNALAAVALGEPDEVRPARATVSITLPDLVDGPARHDGVLAFWFTDDANLARFESVVAGAGGAGLAGEEFGAIGDIETSPVVVAEPIVVRGEAWLDDRWVDGSPRFKHLALAVRAEGLTHAEVSVRWRDHAGSARPAGAAAPAPIPAEARGAAYVQDHPRPRTDGGWAYDAISEVWFDTVAALQARIAWFAQNQVGREADDLFARSWFLPVREQVVSKR